MRTRRRRPVITYTTEPTTPKTLAELRAIVEANKVAGRRDYEGLESFEIGKLSGAAMFGDNDEAFPSPEEWARIVD